MSYTEPTDVQLSVRRVPDHSMEPNESGGKSAVELPGMFEVGFTLDGVFKPIQTFKAAGLLADIERAKTAKAADPAPSK